MNLEYKIQVLHCARGPGCEHSSKLVSSFLNYLVEAVEKLLVQVDQPHHARSASATPVPLQSYVKAVNVIKSLYFHLQGEIVKIKFAGLAALRALLLQQKFFGSL